MAVFFIWIHPWCYQAHPLTSLWIPLLVKTLNVLQLNSIPSVTQVAIKTDIAQVCDVLAGCSIPASHILYEQIRTICCGETWILFDFELVKGKNCLQELEILSLSQKLRLVDCCFIWWCQYREVLIMLYKIWGSVPCLSWLSYKRWVSLLVLWQSTATSGQSILWGKQCQLSSRQWSGRCGCCGRPLQWYIIKIFGNEITWLYNENHGFGKRPVCGG